MKSTAKVLVLLAVFFFGGMALWRLNKDRLHTQDLPRNLEDPSADSEEHLVPSIVNIEDEAVTRQDVDFEYALHTLETTGDTDLTPMPKSQDQIHRDAAALKEELLSTIVERKVLYKFIQRDKAFSPLVLGNQQACLEEWRLAIEQGPDLFRAVENRERLKTRTCEISTLSKFLSEVLYREIKVTDEEISEYFQSHVHEFRGAERVEIRQIVVATESEAYTLIAKLNKQNFEDYAKERSITPEGRTGGRVGPFAKGQLPAVFDIAFTLRVGDISPIQKSNYGHHIIMVTRKYKKDELELDEVKDKIRAQILEIKQKSEYKKWVEQAVHSVKVDTAKPIW